MNKVVSGVIIMFLSIYGATWWHNAILSSGIDENRNILQYYLPYILLLGMATVGIYLIFKNIKSINDLYKK